MLDKLSSNQSTDFDDGFAVGFMFGKSKNKIINSKDDDWKPPDWWIPVPEPSDYDVYFLVQVNNPPKQIQFELARPDDANTGYGNHSIDWGDGIVTNYEEVNHWNSYHYHTYNAIGQYLIKISADSNSCFLQSISTNILLIAKFGAEIVLNNDEISGKDYHTQISFRSTRGLHWVVIKNRYGLPRKQAFENCDQLRRVDIAVPPSVIPYGTFLKCKQLKKFDFSTVTTIESMAFYESGFEKVNVPFCISVGDNAFNECHGLTSVNMPLCTSAGDSAFSQCYQLRETVFAEDCTFGNYCFEDCYCLYSSSDRAIR